MNFTLFMVTALENDELMHEAPAIIGCRHPLRLPMPLISRLDRSLTVFGGPSDPQPSDP